MASAESHKIAVDRDRKTVVPNDLDALKRGHRKREWFQAFFHLIGSSRAMS
ncbi:MAG: hypothetical protein L0G27_08780 [Paracoccus sp. (in: a-proteobacteria)]|nr:hypothetical protein [Paracoccus sp. (in: a-proteobacteria)]